MKYKELLRRVVEISYKMKLSHVGSCLTALPIIAEIYEQKKVDEKFVLSAGHAHLAHLVVMEARMKMGDIMPEFNVESLLSKYGIHCDRRAGCDATTGSLGHGIGIAVGMALADRSKNVYCLISDGECAEGSIWEALRIANEQKLGNLRVYVNCNGWGAYKSINNSEHSELKKQLGYFNPMRSHVNIDQLKSSRMMPEFHKDNPYMFIVNTEVKTYPQWLQSQEAHYRVLDEQSYNELMEVLK